MGKGGLGLVGSGGGLLGSGLVLGLLGSGGGLLGSGLVLGVAGSGLGFFGSGGVLGRLAASGLSLMLAASGLCFFATGVVGTHEITKDSVPGTKTVPLTADSQKLNLMRPRFQTDILLRFHTHGNLSTLSLNVNLLVHTQSEFVCSHTSQRVIKIAQSKNRVPCRRPKKTVLR